MGATQKPRESSVATARRGCIIALLLLASGWSGCSGVKGGFRWPQQDARAGSEKAQQPPARQSDEAALAQWEAELRDDPANPIAHRQIAEVYARQAEYKLAAEHFAAALKLVPDSFQTAMDLARCYVRLASTSMDRPRYLEAAARAYRHAQSLNTGSFKATLELAQCYRHLGETRKALEALRSAAQLYPESAEVNGELAAVYHRSGDYATAIKYYRRAIQSSPPDARLECGIGRSYAALARAGGPTGGKAREQAVAHLRRALELDPEDGSARGILARLEPYQWRSITVIQGEEPGTTTLEQADE